MDYERILREQKKKTISLEDLRKVLRIKTDAELYGFVQERGDLLKGVKASKTNGNLQYPLYKKYRIVAETPDYAEEMENIRKLHPALLRNEYLLAHPEVYAKEKDLLENLSHFFFSNGKSEPYISKNERSFLVCGQEKEFTKKERLLKSLGLSEDDLRYFSTPSVCFHDYFRKKKDREKDVLLICENKDPWYDIRKLMHTENQKTFLGITISGVVLGEGNQVTEKDPYGNTKFQAYLEFLRMKEPVIYYWGDIDRAGFDIYQRFKSLHPELAIELFLPGYQMMLQMAQQKMLS